MTIEITGIGFDESKQLHIYGIDREKLVLARTNRELEEEPEVELVFTKNDIEYLFKFLHRQKAVKDAKPKTLGDALHAIIGTVTNIQRSYMVPTY